MSKDDLVGKIIDYEDGNMTDEELIAFFQELIDSGMCWQLQGHYGRMASILIEEGLCEPRKQEVG